jgi:hypothetical protein
MRRAFQTLLLTGTFFALIAAAALATNGQDGGEGLWGETDDKVITNAGFFLIGVIPLFLFTMSMIMSFLDRRKDRRKAAEKARKSRADMRGGW